MKVLLTGTRIIGLGLWVAILSMAIAAIFFRHGTEEDATLVFVSIMDFIYGFHRDCNHWESRLENMP